ncbi:MAG: DNA polymerase III subunit gamma/tau [Candidatus Caldatribacteriota bacterium]
MEYQTLYRKWRPQLFEDIIGQEHITKTLMNAITLNRVAHAYIFSGPRGVGKTTTARILAKALNCQEGPTAHPCNQCSNCTRITEGFSMDVVEIDGASNRGIDDIRELRNKVKFAPSEGKYRIYIIDEVHMLTPEAFNALLKTLEEPPQHIVFIFATTAPHKIPETITSRCQWFNFRRIPLPEILNKLKKITESEKIEVETSSLRVIAQYSTGSLRDAESMLDQLIAYCGRKINFSSVKDLLGAIEEEMFEDFLRAIINQEINEGIEIINQLLESGRDAAQFIKGLMEYIHNLTLVKYCSPEVMQSRGIFSEDWERLKKQSDLVNLNTLLSLIDELAEIEKKLRYFSHPWILLEMLVVKFTIEKNYNLKKESEKDSFNPKSDFCSEGKSHKHILGIENQSTSKGDKEIKQEDKILKVKSGKKKEKEKDVLSVNMEKEHINLKEIFPQLLEKIKKEKISIYSFLNFCSSINLENDKLIISFSPEYCFHKESLEKKNNKLYLKEFLRKETGQIFNIECEINQQKGIENESYKEKKTKKIDNQEIQEVNKKEETEIIEENLMIKESLNLFKGKIIKE